MQHIRSWKRPVLLLGAILIAFYAYAVVKYNLQTHQEAVVVSKSGLSTDQKNIKTNLESVDSQSIVTLVNDIRESKGLPLLIQNFKLQVSSYKKCQDILVKNYWSHNTPDGRDPWYFIKQEGYGYESAGENLAQGYTSSQQVVESWQNSASHYRNIINPDFRDTGVAFCTNGTRHIVVQHFAKPL